MPPSSSSGTCSVSRRLRVRLVLRHPELPSISPSSAVQRVRPRTRLADLPETGAAAGSVLVSSDWFNGAWRRLTPGWSASASRRRASKSSAAPASFATRRTSAGAPLRPGSFEQIAQLGALRSAGQAQRALDGDLPVAEGLVGEDLRLLRLLKRQEHVEDLPDVCSSDSSQFFLPRFLRSGCERLRWRR